jgi:hypothetical protein
MKNIKIYLASFLFIVVTMGTATADNHGIAEKVNGKEVYVMNLPVAEYEVLGHVSLDMTSERTLDNTIEQLVVKAIQKQSEFGTVDAIITRDGRSAMCIRFTGENKGQTRLVKSFSRDLYMYSTPEKEYTIITTGNQTKTISQTEPMYEIARLFTTGAANQINDRVDSPVDGVIIRGEKVDYIKYK